MLRCGLKPSGLVKAFFRRHISIVIFQVSIGYLSRINRDLLGIWRFFLYQSLSFGDLALFHISIVIFHHGDCRGL